MKLIKHQNVKMNKQKRTAINNITSGKEQQKHDSIQLHIISSTCLDRSELIRVEVVSISNQSSVYKNPSMVASWLSGPNYEVVPYG